VPRVIVGDQGIYFEIAGSGFPLVLIRGLGSSAAHWYKQISVFADHFSVLAFDHRGIGRSPQSTAFGCSIGRMASDTICLMDVLGIRRAHVLGVSMGGMIAQEIAINFPKRILGLVLASTHCGGRLSVRPDQWVLERMQQWIVTGKSQDFEMALPCLFSPEICQDHPDIIAKFRETTHQFEPIGKTLKLQWQAVIAHNAGQRLVQIKAPTLVITGSKDILIPPGNADILKRLIPNARRRIIEGGGHVVLMEQPETFNAEVLDFLCHIPTV
jgi:3-oxoadipate enol-lactonase